MGKSHDQHGVSIKYEFPTDESFNVNLTAWGWDDVHATDDSGSRLGKWTHVAITKSGNHYKTFINGVMLYEVETEHDYSIANSEDMYFGKYNDSWYPMNGMLDEVRIYNRTLTDGEISELAQFAEDNVEGEPYAVLSNDGKTVTFFYDGNKASQGGVDINNTYNESHPYSAVTFFLTQF